MSAGPATEATSAAFPQNQSTEGVAQCTAVEGAKDAEFESHQEQSDIRVAGRSGLQIAFKLSASNMTYRVELPSLVCQPAFWCHMHESGLGGDTTRIALWCR